MTKYMVAIGTFLTTGFLLAGGNINPHLSAVADLSNKVCKKNTVYLEKDVRLMWQDEAYKDVEDGAYQRNHSAGKAGKLSHAINYCRKLDYDGYTDWRLPTVDELRHVHKKKGQVFTYFRAGDFWTSTPSTDSRYYVVFPADAYAYKKSKRQSNYIRCVRCMGDEVSNKRYLLSDDPELKTR